MWGKSFPVEKVFGVKGIWWKNFAVKRPRCVQHKDAELRDVRDIACLGLPTQH